MSVENSDLFLKVIKLAFPLFPSQLPKADYMSLEHKE